MSQPNQLWWTEADRGELDTIVWRLVEAGFAHRACTNCPALGRWCPPMRAAFEAVEGWLHARQLLSRAEWLRREQDELNIVLGGRLERPAA